jgi:PAS domain S-box-containing protein
VRAGGRNTSNWFSAEAKSAIERLRATDSGDALVRTLVDAAADYAIFVLDPSGRVVTWNRDAEALKGYASAEILGQHCSIFYSPEDRANGTPALELSVAASEGRSECDGWRLRRDGTRFWAHVVICAFKDGVGNVMGFAKITHDLTARGAAAKALSDANRELEAFSYAVAHDLRAPLRGMNGFARVLLDTYGEKLDAQGKDWLQEILLNAKKMGALIDALLTLGRLTRAELRVERVDLSALAGVLVAQLSAGEPERAVEIVIQPGLFADLDPNLAQALVANLLGNAWKFSAKTPSARIEVGVTETPGPPTFFVRDNGAGFDMTFAEKLFTPFQRLHTVDEFFGTGIGLATAQRIVHRHGGRIWAQGTVGVGATFFFTLPEIAGGK